MLSTSISEQPNKQSCEYEMKLYEDSFIIYTNGIAWLLNLPLDLYKNNFKSSY